MTDGTQIKQHLKYTTESFFQNTQQQQELIFFKLQFQNRQKTRETICSLVSGLSLDAFSIDNTILSHVN